VCAADSFEGLPVADPQRYPWDLGSQFNQQRGFAVSLDEVRANFEKYGLLDGQVEFVKGWFSETLPKLADRNWAVIRLDGDMYQSTLEALMNLYPGLSPGGFVIIDDFGAVPACRQAVLDFRQANQITEEMRVIDWSGVYWQRRSEAPSSLALVDETTFGVDCGVIRTSMPQDRDLWLYQGHRNSRDSTNQRFECVKMNARQQTGFRVCLDLDFPIGIFR
jgi:hypothetical protein